MKFFSIGSPELFAWGWLWTMILLTSTSWIARITGVSHQHLADLKLFQRQILYGKLVTLGGKNLII
jgi:hypothetical protein